MSIALTVTPDESSCIAPYSEIRPSKLGCGKLSIHHSVAFNYRRFADRLGWTSLAQRVLSGEGIPECGGRLSQVSFPFFDARRR